MRLPDWRGRLATYISESRTRPFQYGTFDCARFAAGAVEAITGRRLFLDIEYDDEESGQDALQILGFQSHVEAAESVLPVAPVSMARYGDLAVISELDEEVLGVVGGGFVLVATNRGLRNWPFKLVDRILTVE
jgi:hypothetical protein